MVGPEVWKLSTSKIDTPSARKLSISSIQVNNIMQGRLRGRGVKGDQLSMFWAITLPHPSREYVGKGDGF